VPEVTVSAGEILPWALALFAAGLWLGARAANSDWLITGGQSPRWGRTPHHCRGKFYYVIPEPDFCREYVSRAAVEIPLTPDDEDE
jgi:hypothetical protein